MGNGAVVKVEGEHVLIGADINTNILVVLADGAIYDVHLAVVSGGAAMVEAVATVAVDGGVVEVDVAVTIVEATILVVMDIGAIKVEATIPGCIS